MDDKLKILEMLKEGTISVDEASQLLEAVAGTGRFEGSAARTGTAPDGDAATFSKARNMGRFRRLSQIPLAVSLVALIVSGWGAYALRVQADGRRPFWFAVLVGFFAVALMATALSLWATTVPWLHVRVQNSRDEEKRARQIAISLPLPLGLAGWGLRIANRFVDPDVAGALSAAATLAKTMRHDLGKRGAEPIAVEVEDEDERVQVYIG
jgi:hypothetical protein